MMFLVADDIIGHPGGGYAHFPEHRLFEDTGFDQLLSGLKLLADPSVKRYYP